MALKISQLPAAAIAKSTAEIEISQDGVSQRATLSQAISGVAEGLVASAIAFTPTGTVAAVEVQGAINEVVSDLAASTGASLVGFVQSGSGAISRTVEKKLQERVSVLDFIPVALYAGILDGTNTTGLQDYIRSALAAHSHIHFPKGTYLLSGSLVELTLSDNHHLSGDGMFDTIISQGSNVTGGTGSLSANGGSSSTYIDGLRIHDLCLDGLVATRLFSEFQHLCSLNGVKDAVIERVRFLGFRGDGLYLGSGIVTGHERHNINVTVQDCLFDGVNRDNRNGISVIDGDGIHILNNTFRNCSKSTMPGPIDLEPDSVNNFAIFRNIEIVGNRIESYGGGHGISVAVYPAGALTTPPFGIKVANNYIAGATKANAFGIFVRTGETISASSAPMAIEVSGNEVHDSGAKAIYPIFVRAVRDIKVHDNSFNGGTVASFGDETDTAVGVYDADIRNNIFYKNGNANGGVIIASVRNVRFWGNTVDSPNGGTAVHGVRFLGSGVTTDSDNVSIIGNTFIKGASQTASIGVMSHTLNTATNTYYGNRDIGGTLTNQFTADFKFSGFYQTGTWVPVLAGTSTPGTQGYTTQQAVYTRVGRLITVSATISLSSLDAGIAGSVAITGLPFASANVVNQNHTIGGMQAALVNFSAGYSYLTGLLIPNTTQILVRESGDNVDDQGLPVTALAATSRFSFTLTYITADA